jgi:single-strand DNA-binding protein
MDINNVTLTGRLGSDLELKYTKSGTAVTGCSLAVEAGFGDNKKTLWIGLDFWGKTAEAASKFLAKGRKIAVTGRLDQSEYEKDGKTIQKTRVVVENWTFADSEKSGNSSDRPARQEPRQEARREQPRQIAPQPTPPASGADDGDEIPFSAFDKHSPLPL